MRTSNKKSTDRPSRQDRKVIASGNGGKVKNGNSKAGSGIAASSGTGLHLLSQELKGISLFQLKMISGNNDIYPMPAGLLEIINTEAKQLQCIEDLYAIVKAQPKYKNMKEPQWTIDSSPIEVICRLLRKLSPLAKVGRWTVDSFVDKADPNKLRYRFVAYKYYSSNELRDSEEFLSLDFLPFLKDRDIAMHDMIIDTVALVSKANKVPLWDEDGDYSLCMKELGSSCCLGNNNHVLMQQYASYFGGVASQYLKLIKSRRRVITIEMIRAQVLKYRITSWRKRRVIYWVQAALELAEKGGCIADHTYVPHYKKGTPWTPYRSYKFIWSCHQNDCIHKRANSVLQKDLSKYGIFVPLMFSIAKPGQVFKEIKGSVFPVKLYDFMRDGISIFLWRHRTYFYKEMMNAQETPAETLLERIELAEIKDEL